MRDRWLRCRKDKDCISQCFTEEAFWEGKKLWKGKKFFSYFASSCYKRMPIWKSQRKLWKLQNIYFSSFIAILFPPPTTPRWWCLRVSYSRLCSRYFFLFILSFLMLGNRKSFWTACSCIKIEMREIIIRNGMVFREKWAKMFWLFEKVGAKSFFFIWWSIFPKKIIFLFH
jgi:hypothetical protein